MAGAFTSGQKKARESWTPQHGDFVFYYNAFGRVEETTLGEFAIDGERVSDTGCGCCSGSIEIKDLFPLFGIGQMIEILSSYMLINKGEGMTRSINGVWHIYLSLKGKVYTFIDKELSDALWEALKKVLEG